VVQHWRVYGREDFGLSPARRSQSLLGEEDHGPTIPSSLSHPFFLITLIVFAVDMLLCHTFITTDVVPSFLHRTVMLLHLAKCVPFYLFILFLFF
jgi:hypothetical protein